MPKTIHLFVIDPERSFCAVVPQQDQQVLHDGELCVPGAWDDMVRTAGLVKRSGDKIDDIFTSMDEHHLLHIANGIWFRHRQTKLCPDPFTIIYEDNGVIKGKTIGGQELGEFEVFNRVYHDWTIEYLKALKTGGRYPHMIWPPHCLIGTKGATVVEPLMDAYIEWERKNYAFVQYHSKGSNFKTEHFSVVKAEVPDPNDSTTQLCTEVIGKVAAADIILLAGEARSHCLANTVRDIANTFADDSFIKKCILLTDCTSDVPGCESYGEAFVNEMTARGMQTTTSVDFLA